MIRNFLIFLLLISFNANAIAGSVMMAKMSSMTSSIMEETEMTNHSAKAMPHNMSMSSTVDQCHSELSSDSSCEGESSCGLCMMHCSSVLISDISVLVSSQQQSLLQSYHVQHVPSTYSRLLRPPKFS